MKNEKKEKENEKVEKNNERRDIQQWVASKERGLSREEW
jgi:hypothetical protein